MPRLPPDELERYTSLVRRALGAAFLFTPETEIGSAVQAERGMVFPMSLGGHGGTELNARVDKLIQVANEQTIEEATVVDRAGHSRQAYPGLLVYCWLQAYRQTRLNESKRLIEHWAQPLRAWCGALEGQVNQFDWPIGGLSALRGGAATSAAWAALTLYVAGNTFSDRRWAERASNCFGRLGAGQQPSGAFLRKGAGDNPETLWYHELVLLHAAASYAAQSNDALVTASVMQAADYHVNETQPDHATSQPWGLLAFIWRRESRPLADQVLHTLATEQVSRPGGITSMLLADCLYCLRSLK